MIAKLAKLFRTDHDKVYVGIRRFCLHSSAVGFSADFAHACLGKAMVFVEFWEKIHGVYVPYAAFAATIIIYVDGHREKARVRCDRKEPVHA